MVVALAETLRLSSDARVRRAALRKASLESDKVAATAYASQNSPYDLMGSGILDASSLLDD